MVNFRDHDMHKFYNPLPPNKNDKEKENKSKNNTKIRELMSYRSSLISQTFFKYFFLGGFCLNLVINKRPMLYLNWNFYSFLDFLGFIVLIT